MTRRAALASAGLVLAVTGCSHSASAGPPALPPTTAGASLDALRPSVPPGFAQVFPASVQRVTNTAGLISEPWTLAALHGATITVVFAGGDNDCILPDGYALSSTATTVEVALLSKDVKPHAQACSAAGLEGIGTITLDTPLGGRRLLHAPLTR